MQHDRPASFDAAVMAYYPGLRNLARRYKSAAYRDDLVTDTIMRALENWRNFRPDGNMWRWLAWTMRGIVSNQAVGASMQKRQGVLVSIDNVALSTEPNQEHYTDLAAATDKLTGRGGDILLRRAMGGTLKEVGASYSISPEWTRRLEAEARSKLKEAA